MCANIAQFIRDLSIAGLSSNLAYNERVYRLHRYRLDWLAYQNASLLKKPEQKMVEINNQRKAFLDMLAWSRNW